MNEKDTMKRLRATSLNEIVATESPDATSLYEKATSQRLFASVESLNDKVLHEKAAALHIINATLRLSVSGLIF